MILSRSRQDATAETANEKRAKRPLTRGQKLLRALLIAAGVLILLLAAGAAWAYSLPMPKPHPTPQATLVYGANGQVIGQFAEQYRVDVPLTQVPRVVIDAVVSTEDRHFFSEGGVNPTSTIRALFSDVTGSGGLQGGSTITQQYVKQAYLSPKRTITRKIEEAVIAYRLSQSQPKQKILDEYLNTIYWGRGAYGVQAASQAFFGKNVNQLGLPEASLLAAIIKNPGGADPAYNAGLAHRYQADTLKAMVRDKKITKAQAAAVLATPFPKYVIPPATTGSGKTVTTGSDYFLAIVRQQLYQQYGREAVDGGGLRVYTTMDPTLQQEAYSSLYGASAHALHPDKGDPSAAAVTVDDQGHVLAMVGGQNYGKSSVNLAMGSAGGGSGRQAGSTFKAFMLAVAIQEGYSVQSVLPAPPQIVIPNGNANGPWIVKNYEGESTAPAMTLVDATAKSVNTVYAQVVQKLGAAKLDALAESMGIPRSALPHPYLSQVLGTAEVSPLDMANAYATFASGGVYHSPLFITKVTSAAGKPLRTPGRVSTHQVLTPQQAAIEDYVLQQVVQRGTGVAAGGIGSPVAGKTGTTENSGDAWFIGYTPHVTTAVWMGYANSVRSMDGFRGLGSVTGGTIPAELWHDYMSAAIQSEPQLAGQFLPPGSLAGKDLMTDGSPTSSTSSSSSTSSTSSSTTSSTTSTTTAPQKSKPGKTSQTTTATTTAPPTTTATTVAPSTTTTTVATQQAASNQSGTASTTTTAPPSG